MKKFLEEIKKIKNLNIERIEIPDYCEDFDIEKNLHIVVYLKNKEKIKFEIYSLLAINEFFKEDDFNFMYLNKNYFILKEINSNFIEKSLDKYFILNK